MRLIEKSISASLFESISDSNKNVITENVELSDAVSFVNEKIQFLKDNQDYDGAWLNLDETYALVVCWEEGFDVDDSDVIHASDNPEYALCLSIRERNEADLPSYWSLPFAENGEPIIDSVSIRKNEDVTNTVNYLLDEYKNMVSKSEENINESAELTAEVVYHDEDGTRDFTAGKLSDGRYFLIGQQEQIVVSDKDLPSLAKKDMDEYFYDGDGDKEFIEALENGTTLDKNSDLAKIIINASRKYLEDGCYLLSESEDVARDLGIEPGSDEEAQLNSLYDETTEEEGFDIDLAGDKVMEMFNTYGLNELTFHEIENEFIEGLNTFSDIMIVCADLEEKGKVTYDRDNSKIFRKMNESEEVKEEKKVTKVEVLVLPTIKFLWAEGNQDHVAALFGSAEEHDMDFSKFQNAVYVLDQEVSERNGGYDKVKYVANIQVKFTYEDGSTSEETTTYTGRVDCGDGYKYVTVSKNMKNTIQEAYKDAEVIIKEDDNAELKESVEETNMTLKEYAMKVHEGYIDMDVSDTEIDMVVAFVCDFNETPADNYDKFLHLLGERTKVVKANEWNLVCDFTSVFKPYEEKLQEFFNMEYSEFDEAYYEAVVNLEGLIPGMSGEKTYGELINILEGK